MLRSLRSFVLSALCGALLASGCTRDAAAPTAAPAAPAAPAPVKTAPTGPSADTAEYAVSLAPPSAPRAGVEASATFAITAKGSFHVNPDYPIAFTPEGADNARFTADRVRLAASEKTPCAQKAEDACAAVVPLAFTPERAGPATLAGTLAFSVCNPERCLIQKVPLTASLTVE